MLSTLWLFASLWIVIEDFYVQDILSKEQHTIVYVKKLSVMTKTVILNVYSNFVIFLNTNNLNVYIYFKTNEENILTFKTVYFQSVHFKIICLLSFPSLILTYVGRRTSVVVLSDWTLSRSPTGAPKYVPGHDRQNAPLLYFLSVEKAVILRFGLV